MEQMNEPPENRLRVALTGLTVAEKFRDEGLDVPLFIDNIYRYTLVGTEVSALLGRMPSVVGYHTTPDRSEIPDKHQLLLEFTDGAARCA